MMAWIKLIVALLSLLAFASVAHADGPVVGASCTFTWNAVTKNADGTPITDLKEYRLYLSQTPGTYAPPAAVVINAPATQTTCLAAGVTTDGQYYAVVRAVDTAGNQSANSNEVGFVRDTTSPQAPANFTIQLTLQGMITLTPAP